MIFDDKGEGGSGKKFDDKRGGQPKSHQDTRIARSVIKSLGDCWGLKPSS